MRPDNVYLDNDKTMLQHEACHGLDRGKFPAKNAGSLLSCMPQFKNLVDASTALKIVIGMLAEESAIRHVSYVLRQSEMEGPSTVPKHATSRIVPANVVQEKLKVENSYSASNALENSIPVGGAGKNMELRSVRQVALEWPRGNQLMRHCAITPMLGNRYEKKSWIVIITSAEFAEQRIA